VTSENPNNGRYVIRRAFQVASHSFAFTKRLIAYSDIKRNNFLPGKEERIIKILSFHGTVLIVTSLVFISFYRSYKILSRSRRKENFAESFVEMGTRREVLISTQYFGVSRRLHSKLLVMNRFWKEGFSVCCDFFLLFTLNEFVCGNDEFVNTWMSLESQLFLYNDYGLSKILYSVISCKWMHASHRRESINFRSPVGRLKV